MLILYDFHIFILCVAVLQTPNIQISLYIKEITGDWKTNLHSSLHFSSLRKLKSTWNSKAEYPHAFQSHQIEFTLPEGHLNAIAKGTQEL